MAITQIPKLSRFCHLGFLCPFLFSLPASLLSCPSLLPFFTLLRNAKANPRYYAISPQCTSVCIFTKCQLLFYVITMPLSHIINLKNLIFLLSFSNQSIQNFPDFLQNVILHLISLNQNPMNPMSTNHIWLLQLCTYFNPLSTPFFFFSCIGLITKTGFTVSYRIPYILDLFVCFLVVSFNSSAFHNFHK